jgi:hypothetical protein
MTTYFQDLLSVIAGATVAAVSLKVVHVFDFKRYTKKYHEALEGITAFTIVYFSAFFIKPLIGASGLYDDAGLILALTPFVLWVAHEFGISKQLEAKD